MAKQSDPLAGGFEADKTGGLLSGLLAEENELDRRAMVRIGTWGVAAVGAVTLAVMSNQWSLSPRHEQVAATELARQAQQIQSLARENQSETRRLASAIETLNNDRDRLFSRVTVLEQGLDSVTGALARQTTPAPAVSPAPQAATSPQATNTPAPAGPDAPQAAAAPPPMPAPVTTAAAPAPDKTAGNKPAKPEPVAASAATGTIAAASAQASVAPTLSPPASASPASAASLVAKSTMAAANPGSPKLIEPVKAAEPNTKDEKPPEAKVADAKSTDAPPVEKRAHVASLGPPASAPPAASPETTASTSTKLDAEVAASPAAASVQHTEFAVDLGNANTLGGLRAIWRSVRHRNADLAALSPIIVIKEGANGFGMQLRLAAGPLKDAAAAAKICAALGESKRVCEPTIYDGQRLAMTDEEAKSLPKIKADSEVSAKAESAARPSSYRHSRHAKKEEPPPPPPPPPEPKPEQTSVLSSIFGRK